MSVVSLMVLKLVVVFVGYFIAGFTGLLGKGEGQNASKGERKRR
jgi:hypothetical protein